MLELETGAIDYAKYYQEIWSFPAISIKGRVTQVIGLVMEVSGIRPCVGEVCLVEVTASREPLLAEVVGFRQGRALLMPLGSLNGVGPGCRVKATGHPFFVKVGPEILGKVIDGLGNPILDNIEGELQGLLVDNSPPNPLERNQSTR